LAGFVTGRTATEGPFETISSDNIVVFADLPPTCDSWNRSAEIPVTGESADDSTNRSD
jgi:hypothetical protein